MRTIPTLPCYVPMRNSSKPAFLAVFLWPNIVPKWISSYLHVPAAAAIANTDGNRISPVLAEFKPKNCLYTGALYDDGVLGAGRVTPHMFVDREIKHKFHHAVVGGVDEDYGECVWHLCDGLALGRSVSTKG